MPLNYLTTTNGNHVTYSEVWEKTSTGYIVYKYNNHDNGYIDKNPFAMANSNNESSRYEKKILGSIALERGKLYYEGVYNTSRKLVSSTRNYYNDDPKRYDQYVRSVYEIINNGKPGFNKVAYPIYTFSPYLKKVVKTDYYQSGDSSSIVEEFLYNSLGLVQEHRRNQSSGPSLTTVYKYAHDYLLPLNFNPTIGGILSLRYANMVDLPIEVTSYFTKSGEDYVTKSTYFKYEDKKLASVYTAFINSPILKSEFKGTFIDLGNAFNFDSRFTLEKEITRYGGFGTIVEMKSGGKYSCYIWGGNHSVILAEVENARYSDVAFTSFENGDEGNWQWNGGRLSNISMAGRHALSLSPTGGSIFKNGLDPQKKYKVSFWMYDADWSSASAGFGYEPVRSFLGWTLYESSISGVSVYTYSNFDCIIDNISIYPVDAMMTSYTHEPLIGIRSIVYPNGLTKHYDYDSFKRLRAVLDDDQNFIEYYQYNYMK